MDALALSCHRTLVKTTFFQPKHAQQDPALQESTASEPLTLEEEYSMQCSWSEDEKKCTFILLDPDYVNTEGIGNHGGRMAGDVNLYWNDHEDANTAEIEIMVAEAQSRGKGLATEALSLFMAWAAANLNVTTFRAKIGFDNIASQQLFKSLGYSLVGASEVFGEITFELAAPDTNGPGANQHCWKGLLQRAETLATDVYDRL